MCCQLMVLVLDLLFLRINQVAGGNNVSFANKCYCFKKTLGSDSQFVNSLTRIFLIHDLNLSFLNYILYVYT